MKIKNIFVYAVLVLTGYLSALSIHNPEIIYQQAKALALEAHFAGCKTGVKIVDGDEEDFSRCRAETDKYKAALDGISSLGSR